MSQILRSRRDVAVAFAAAIVACGCHAKGTTLDDLAHRDDVRAEATLSPDQCACQCHELVCWNFTCSGPECSRKDEYELRIDHGPRAGDGECLDPLSDVTAELVRADGKPLAPSFVSNGCGELDITWRVSAGVFDAKSPHRVEISDGSATWTIDDPFLTHTLTLVAPPTAAGQPSVVREGESLVVAVSPPLPGATAHASIRASSVPDSRVSVLPVAVTDDGDIAFTIPPGTAPFIYDVIAGVDVVLGSDACRGPDACRGVGAAATWEIAVQGQR